MVILADIGNTRTKLKVNNILYTAHSQDELIKLKGDLNLNNKSCRIFYSSVNTRNERRFIKSFKDYTNEILPVSSLKESQFPIKFTQVSGIGYDRVVGLIGALKYQSPPLITVDCGTAVTVNFLDENYTVLGGVIYPGFFTQAKAMNDYTLNLPILENIRIIEDTPNNTLDAMAQGILNSITGGIIETIKKTKLPIIVTGGYGAIINEILKEKSYDCQYQRDLILDGLEYLIKDLF